MSQTSSWLSLHVHYNSDPHWLLKHGIAPAVDALRDQNLVSQYFFIRYWEQGPHVRLRLRAAGEAQEGASREVAESMIDKYLSRRPSVFRFPTPNMPPSFSQLFISEYGEEALRQKYGDSGQIPFAENNRILQVPYSPEYERYGGEHGVAIAERHFEVSSDHVLRCLSMENGHDFRVILGRGYRLMLYACLALLPDRTAQMQFLQSYENQWNGLIGSLSEIADLQFDRKYKASKPALDRNTAACIALAEGTEEGHVEEREWLQHMRTLRCDLDDAFSGGRLRLPETAHSIDQAISSLLPNYIHMTNNRLGISISDEVYMAYVMRRSLNDYAY
jgi:thiopeptide-type bacteriocin biosynthesis protein